MNNNNDQISVVPYMHNFRGIEAAVSGLYWLSSYCLPTEEYHKPKIFHLVRDLLSGQSGVVLDCRNSAMFELIDRTDDQMSSGPLLLAGCRKAANCWY